MSRITKFASRDPGPAARMSGFMAHLRENGFRLGVSETGTGLAALSHVNAADPDEALLALKSVCAGSAEDVARFDDLFDSFWRNEGRIRQRITPGQSSQPKKHTRSTMTTAAPRADQTGAADQPDSTPGGGSSEAKGEGRLVASSVENVMRKDLRELVSPQDIARAAEIARRLAEAMRDTRSRRRKRAARGREVDLRRVIRKSLGTGGEPLALPRKTRPLRPYKLVALCDVSGSMTVYAKIFLAFLAGLMRADPTTDAYLFHTRLVRITDALRDKDMMRALNRMSLMADGFGGGSEIGRSLHDFGRTYARRFVDGRSVVMVLSDGYDTGEPGKIGTALSRLRKRGCRIIWLNPLKGYRSYAPVAAGMSAALPHLDLFASANTLDDLAQLEREVVRI